jgi:hypothetical protein
MTNQKTWGGIMNEGNIQVPKLWPADSITRLLKNNSPGSKVKISLF